MITLESSNKPVYAWVDGVVFDYNAQQQLIDCASMPFIHHHIAAMPDVHLGRGATVGSVIPTIGAILPSAVGVDIGCGVIAQKTNILAGDLKDLPRLRSDIEDSIPMGTGGGYNDPPSLSRSFWRTYLSRGYDSLCKKYPDIFNGRALEQLGTLGSGNHFIEVCLDETEAVWIMLHSGSRGAGNRIGQFFINEAKEISENNGYKLPNRDLAYVTSNHELFGDYIMALSWAQEYAKYNRLMMMNSIICILQKYYPFLRTDVQTVNCHHNYVAYEEHFGSWCWVTRKGAVNAESGRLGIIPGSMGDKSYIVKGKGNPDSFNSCSHGAGRRLSRGEAKRSITLDDHIEATRGVECRKDESVIDESPAAYKPIDDVMAAQADLVEIVHTLKQVLSCKG
jgi:tRNA-splicing ligase RtcB